MPSGHTLQAVPMEILNGKHHHHFACIRNELRKKGAGQSDANAENVHRLSTSLLIVAVMQHAVQAYTQEVFTFHVKIMMIEVIIMC